MQKSSSNLDKDHARDVFFLNIYLNVSHGYNCQLVMATDIVIHSWDDVSCFEQITSQPKSLDAV